MGECTCHLGAPPCGYCVEGTEDYQEAVAYAEGLDDRELDRLYVDICDMMEERGLKLASSAAVKAIPPGPEITAPTAPHPTPAISPAPVPAPTKAEWVGRLKANASFAGAMQQVGTAYARAARLPINRGLWDTLDKADSGCWRNSNFSSLTGDGAKHDNRRAPVRRA
ncbi:hypothetical protein FW320_13130 [Azospirillum sp. Vi22]|uniref:hypothetical protein n=1 Tax=Azospirillum baldaniorum TaxID=1064539 RepID=UPI00157AF8B6|nr:hypothetical protein [Azospirillum baldaniorum]NUB07114.1 hypothetical protein [Azospirillum baldaniorum]